MLVLPVSERGSLIIELEDFNITVAYLGMEDGEARIGIDAPEEYNIRRGRRGIDNSQKASDSPEGSPRDN